MLTWIGITIINLNTAISFLEKTGRTGALIGVWQILTGAIIQARRRGAGVDVDLTILAIITGGANAVISPITDNILTRSTIQAAISLTVIDYRIAGRALVAGRTEAAKWIYLIDTTAPIPTWRRRTAFIVILAKSSIITWGTRAAVSPKTNDIITGGPIQAAISFTVIYDWITVWAIIARSARARVCIILIAATGTIFAGRRRTAFIVILAESSIITRGTRAAVSSFPDDIITGGPIQAAISLTVVYDWGTCW